MGFMAEFFLGLLTLFTRPSGPPEGTSVVSHDAAMKAQQAAVEAPEAALLQEEADLEASCLETPQLAHRTSDQVAVDAPEAVMPDQDGVVGMGDSPPRLQLLTTANQASGQAVAQGQPPVAGRVRVSIEARTRTDQRSTAKLKQHLSLSFLLVIFNTSVLIDLFFIRCDTKPVSKNPSLIVASTSAFVSLISGFGLMFDTMRQMTSRGRRVVQSNPPCSWSKLALCLSTVSLAFTVLALVASFLPETYHYLCIVLVPTLAVAGIYFYDVRQEDGDVVLGGGDDPHKADRKRSFQLTINMTTFSFMGFLGTIIGYHKRASNRAEYTYVKISIYLMLGAAVTGFVTLLLNRRLRRKDWKTTAVGNAVMLGLLVAAVLMVATTFLQGGFVAATAFPVAIAAATWYFMEEYHVPYEDYGAQETELIKPQYYTLALTGMSLSFGAVMTIFAGFLGGEAKGKILEVCIFLVVSSFVSSVSLGALTFRTPKTAGHGGAAKALGCLTPALLVLAALALVTYVG